MLALPYPVAEVVEHFMVGAALADLNNLAPGQQVAVPFPEISDVIHLQPGGGGQYDVGQLGRRRQEKVGHGHKLDLFKRAIHLFGVGPGQYRVGTDQKQHLHRIGFFR